MGRRNRGDDIDTDQVRDEQSALLSQFEDFRLQQLFLEEQRQRLIDQQKFDFEGLLSSLNALKEQQQQGFEGQLAQSEAFLNDLSARNQQLSGVLEGQGQTQRANSAAQQQDIQGSQDFLSQLINEIQNRSGQATQTSNQRSDTQAGQAIAGEDFRRSREQQLSNIAAGANQRLEQDRQNLLSRTVQDERKSRARREGSRANLRGQPAPGTTPQANRPQTDTTVRTAQARQQRGQQIQQRRQRAGEPGFLSGGRSLTREELEELRREFLQGRAGFTGPISGRRSNTRRQPTDQGLFRGTGTGRTGFVGPISGQVNTRSTRRRPL